MPGTNAEFVTAGELQQVTRLIEVLEREALDLIDLHVTIHDESGRIIGTVYNDTDHGYVFSSPGSGG